MKYTQFHNFIIAEFLTLTF